MKRILSTRRHYYLARVCVFLLVAALIAGTVGCVPVSQNLEIQDWYDLDTVRDNLGGNHKLMNDLDSTTDGYEELASPTANDGFGWQPIGNWDERFNGTFDGQGYEIRDLFIDGDDEVGLFSFVGEGAHIKDIGVVNVNVTGQVYVGALAGYNLGHVSNSYATGSVVGEDVVGGLIGSNAGPISDSHFIGNVNADQTVGGLVGGNELSSVSDCYSIGNVTGLQGIGGLIGDNYGPLSDSYFTGSVTGERVVGGLVGKSEGVVSNSYSTGSVYGIDYVGGLVGANSGIVSNSYSAVSVTGERRVGGLLGHYDHGTVSNSYATGNVTGNEDVGGLVGLNKFDDIVNNSFWDTQTSGQATSDGGTGKNTTEMQDIATFSGAGWDIIEVGSPGTRNPSYIWNIVDSVTYPFLSWQPV